MPDIQLLNMDCMEYMAGCADKAFDLAIVDPPYGIKRDGGFSGFGKFGKHDNLIARKQYHGSWDNKTPCKLYFDELQRISKNQIIFGGNFFTDKLPVNGHWFFWDKLNTMPTFSDGELAYTSFPRVSVKKLTLEYNGLLGKEENRIHATQKPVALYKWILTNYAKPGQKIFDSHGGSFSSAIAAYYFGCDFVGCELDKDYYEMAVTRFERETRQAQLFGFEPTATQPNATQEQLFEGAI